MKNLEKQAMAIVAQLFDLAEVPVDKRQEINDVAYDYVTEQLIIADVSNWVTIESNTPPERCTEVMVKYKDGRKTVALFDGDNRFYTLKDDNDISEDIISWHKLP